MSAFEYSDDEFRAARIGSMPLRNPNNPYVS